MTAENRNENDDPTGDDPTRSVPGGAAGDAPGATAPGDALGATAPRDDAGVTAPGGDGSGGDGSGGLDDTTVSDEELEQLIADAMAAEQSVQEVEVEAPAEEGADAETLAHLQRVTAEYANYRRRTEQEKLAARDANTADVLRSLLPVLDDFDRAAEHGDLPEDGAITVVVKKLQGALEKLGLEAYGEKGEPFDPNVHEAIAQLPNPEATGETIADVVQRGYRVGERIVRVAKVAVFMPAS